MQEVTYNSLMRPATLTEGGHTATFVYDASGERKKMTVTQGGTVTQTKYYLGDGYETDGEKTVLYINGNAYSSPIVYVKEGGEWKIYYICRDYLGSITHLANEDGTLAQELSYDAWGRLRNPQTREVYGASEQPVPKLGRGYTGHEHLSLFGLVNMNARLYDPVLGRFLSPDPYVQMPDNLQNLNRYSYCLNNPLAYVDEDGEFWWFVAAAVIGAYIGGVSSNHGELNPVEWDYSSPSTYLGMGIGALGGYVGAYGIANPGTVGFLVGASTPYASVGIGITAASAGVGAIGNGTDWKFDLQWSTAAGGGGQVGLGTVHTDDKEEDPLQSEDDFFNPDRYKDRLSHLNVIQEAFGTGSTVSSVLAERRYSEYFGTWTGKNGKLYDMKFNGNGATGGKHKFARSSAMKIGKVGKLLGILDLIIYSKEIYENDEFGINEGVESSVKAFSIFGGIYGLSFGIGWELGAKYGPIHRLMNHNKY